MVLQDFTDHEWEIFSGCKSVNPQWARVKVLTVGARKAMVLNGLLILDGNVVEIGLYDHNGERLYTYSYSAATSSFAAEMAEMLAERETLRLNFLTMALGFKKM